MGVISGTVSWLGAHAGAITAASTIATTAQAVDTGNRMAEERKRSKAEAKKQKDIALEKRKLGIDKRRKQLLGKGDTPYAIGQTGATGIVDTPSGNTLTGQELG